MSSNDLTALGFLDPATRLGRRIPEKLSLIGFDDLFLCEMVHPALTTLHLSRKEIATRAFYALQSTRGRGSGGAPPDDLAKSCAQGIDRASNAAEAKATVKQRYYVMLYILLLLLLLLLAALWLWPKPIMNRRHFIELATGAMLSVEGQANVIYRRAGG